MSASGEVEAPALEQQTVEVPPTEEPKKEASKPVKERKPKVPKEKKPKQPKAAAHPPYFQVFLILHVYILFNICVRDVDS